MSDLYFGTELFSELDRPQRQMSRPGHRVLSYLQLDSIRRSRAKQLCCGAHDHATPTPVVDWASLISPR
jgi:hypothetical protein